MAGGETPDQEPTQDPPKYVYAFAEGNKDMKDILGGKGANLAEMTNLGLPVPPGFTITTEACRAYLEHGEEPPELAGQIDEHLDALQRAMDKRLGDADDPLLVSVRSGAAFSMPGMMETVLNVGLNDESVVGLARIADDERFAWDSYRRLIQMFGKTVLGIEGEHFDKVFDAAKSDRSTDDDLDLDADALRTIVDGYKAVVTEHAGREFPQDPREQLALTVRAVFASWNAPRAVVYRRRERIPADLGTAVSVVAMVFGNLGPDSGTGVAFTRDPASGEQGIYGDYLANAQGEDVVAGIRNTLPLAELEGIDPESYRRLLEIMATLERHYLDLCDIEFTIERGTLWMLQTRIGKRGPAAAFVVACQLVDEGLIDLDEALRRVTGEQLAQLMFPRFDDDAAKERLTAGMNASPGAASGVAVFDSATAVARAAEGERVILVRRETNPDDLDGMIAAQGVLTSRGGRTSHAAVVARGMGRTCVCGAEQLDVDVVQKRLTGPGGVEVVEGDMLSIDGSTGEVFLGEVPVVPSPVVEYFEGALDPDGADTGDLVRAVHRLVTHADDRRRLAVRANADTGEDAARARRFGAEGIGLCRTEHMFLGKRREQVERLVLADDDDERGAALDALLPLQRADFIELFTRDGGAAGDDPAARPAAARVPARPHRAVGPGRGRGGARRRRPQGRDAARRRAQAQRGQPDVRPARGAAGHRVARALRHAGQGHRTGRGEAAPRRRRGEPGDHDPAGRRRPGAAGRRRGDHRGARRRVRTVGGRPGRADRHDDRAAPRRADRGADRRVRAVLLVRHQRPHPDHLGVLPRRRRELVLRPLPRTGRVRGVAVRVHRRRGRRQAGADRGRRGPRHPAGPQARRLRRARWRSGLRALLPRGRAWTTCRARRSACPSRGWRRAGRWWCSRRVHRAHRTATVHMSERVHGGPTVCTVGQVGRKRRRNRAATPSNRPRSAHPHRTTPRSSARSASSRSFSR